MNKSECLIKGYEIGKNHKLHGEIKLAKEVAALKTESQNINLCETCKFGLIKVCEFPNLNNNVYPVYNMQTIGYSNRISSCDKYLKK